ncbi:hypothetical protein OSB04_019917 [Centaurea solstitialis]|uniref:Uncharacterized protein n=1 Tax=Centaurea solstitialis TaxID=347529 RepID=A0AA38SSW2_9ASTR|nr:hypothetical protein OSB04_019917 [Centaurea solstitialis]
MVNHKREDYYSEDGDSDYIDLDSERSESTFSELVPRVPATTIIEEIPEYYKPKPVTCWDEDEKELASLTPKCKRLLIMALPNEIFESFDHCSTSMNLWNELQRQLEG